MSVIKSKPNTFLVIVIVLLACTSRADMHPAKYVFGSDGKIKGHIGGYRSNCCAI